MTRVGRSFLPCVRIADPKIDCQGASCVGTSQLGFRLGWGGGGGRAFISRLSVWVRAGTSVASGSCLSGDRIS